MTDIDLESVVDELRRCVDDRRREGLYPEGLEAQLEAEFTHMMRAIHRDEIDTSRLAHLAHAAAGAVHGIDASFDASSRIPGGASVHAATARLVQRHTGDLASSVRAFASVVSEALDESRRLIEAQRAADERQLLDVMSSVVDRLAVLDHIVEIVRDLDERMMELESRSHQP